MTKNRQFPADLVTFTEEILNGKLHFFVQCEKFRFGDVFSHENKKTSSHKNYFWYKLKVRHPMGRLIFIFYQKHFYDKMDLRFYHFHVTNCLQSYNLENFSHCTKLQIWSRSLKKSLMENLIFCAVSTFVKRHSLS